MEVICSLQFAVICTSLSRWFSASSLTTAFLFVKQLTESFQFNLTSTECNLFKRITEAEHGYGSFVSQPHLARIVWHKETVTAFSDELVFVYLVKFDWTIADKMHLGAIIEFSVMNELETD